MKRGRKTCQQIPQSPPVTVYHQCVPIAAGRAGVRAPAPRALLNGRAEQQCALRCYSWECAAGTATRPCHQRVGRSCPR